MGGRGSSSGAGARLPKAQTQIDLDNLPALTGSEKQIKWANSIREEVVNKLAYEMYETEDGRVTTAIDHIFSESDMKKWVGTTKEVFGDANKSILAEKVNNSISALNTAVTQYTNLKNLISNETSARFWIDHRNTHPADPDWKKLRKKIVGH